MSETKSPDRVETIARTVQSVSVLVGSLSVIAGIVFSILSFNAARQKDALAREAEARTREFELKKYYDEQRSRADKAAIEAAKPFLELRQKLYLDAIQNAGVLVNPTNHTDPELAKATKRFWELYWAELCMVESKEVESAMIGLGDLIADTSAPPHDRQRAAVKLAHMLRDSLVQSWGIADTNVVGEVNR